MAKQAPQNTPPKSPTQIPASGWKTIALKIKDQIGEDNVAIVSAGVAFYAFLAIFPAIISMISIYGLVMDPQQIQDQISQLSSMMPQQAFSVIQDQVNKISSTSGETLGWGMAIGILFSLWSSNKGIKSLFTGVDIAYDTRSNRGFFKQNALTLLFTFGAIIMIILSMVLIVAFPALVGNIGLPSQVEDIISWLRWVVLAIIVVFFLCLVYMYAPERPRPKFRWVLLGAIVATVLWLIASWGFSYYVSKFGSYGEMYGSISAVVVLLMWLYLSSFIILLGAELNSVIENFAKNHRSTDHYNNEQVK